ncbi:MAG: ABC transporter permease [Planctomycetota bacterium]
MLRFICWRLLWLPPVLVLLIVGSTFLMRAAPGSPFAAEKQADPQMQKQLEKKWGLDDTGWVYIGKYLKGLLEGDLGPSYKVQGKTVNELLAPAFPVSMALGLMALFIALGVGLPAGMIAGLRQNTMWDYGAMALALIGVSLPTFVIGSFLLLGFVFHLHLFPVGGWGTVKQLVLPAVTLSAPFAAYIARLARAGVLEVIHEDYMKTARAKGLPRGEVVLKHLIRGAILPVVSYLGPAVAAILTGGFVVEKLFTIPGMGSYFVAAAINRDYTLELGVLIVYSTLIMVCNLGADVARAMIDPRVRLGG